MADFASLLNALNTTVVGAFGRDVVYQHESSGPQTVRGIFQATREAEASAPGVYAVLFVRLADLAAPPARGDAVEIDGAAYKIFDIEADTSGAVVLRLRQV